MLTLNVTGFYETFTDFQAQTYSAILTSFQLTNAGKLITQGAEVEAILRPADGLSLTGNLAYTDTEVRGLIGICYAGQRDRKRTRLNSSPSCESRMPPSACKKKN